MASEYKFPMIAKVGTTALRTIFVTRATERVDRADWTPGKLIKFKYRRARFDSVIRGRIAPETTETGTLFISL